MRTALLFPYCLLAAGFLACSSDPLPSPTDPTGAGTSPVADGACLLSYNTALTDGDPCCYHKGAANTCSKAMVCNERSGAGCCLIYGTENTAGGERCCLYADGGPVDSPAECAQLLSSAQ